MSLDADLPDHLDVGQAHHDLFHPVHLERAHAAFDRLGEQLRHPCPLLDQLLDRVIGHQQFMQADPALVAGLAALVATNRAIQLELPILPVDLGPGIDELGRFRRRVRLRPTRR